MRYFVIFSALNIILIVLDIVWTGTAFPSIVSRCLAVVCVCVLENANV